MYIALDGDNIGEKIEALILGEKLKELSDFNQKVSNTIKKIEELILEKNGEVYLSGGDNILAFCLDYDGIIDFLKKFNKENSDLQFSVGYAIEVKLAHLALKYAKGAGKGKMINIRVKDNELIIESSR